MRLTCTLVLPPGHDRVDLRGCTVELRVEDTGLADAPAVLVGVARSTVDALVRAGDRLGPIEATAPAPPPARSWNVRGVIRSMGAREIRYLTTQAVPVTRAGLVDVPVTAVGA